MGRVVILSQAFPLRLCLCPLSGRGRGRRLVMVVNCGTRKCKELGDVAPVTGPRRAVTYCDGACTNAQRPNSRTSHPLSRLLLAVDNDGSYPFVVATVCPQHLTHTPPTNLSLLRLPRPSGDEIWRTFFLTSTCIANAPSRRAPSIANPIEASSWLKHLRFRDLPHKVAQPVHFAQEGWLFFFPTLHFVLALCDHILSSRFSLFSYIFISYLLFILLFAYCHLHYSTHFIAKCVRSKTCAQTFREPLIWALT